ncbi:MAG: glycogen/starch/alpha-glucan phosphorylase, partial [Thermicanus sp.]|nr:glycogen/starch/alpha-glucan phosphorylase [Thermicanus sp.]
GGRVWMEKRGGRLFFHHEGYEAVLAVPYYVPIVGYRNNIVNTLRLWSAESIFKEFNINALSERDYTRMMDYKRSTEAISGFLYPADSTLSGKILRIKQQYFLVSASLQDLIKRYKRTGGDLRRLPEKIAIHINDTHPSLAIPEMMRILMDEEGFGWEEAWNLTVQTFSYTNHTILSEALEKWPIDMIQKLLPRIYMIIHEINERFCQDLWQKHPGDWDRIHQMAIEADGQVKMAHLAIVGSHSVNGVSEIHTDILKEKVMNLFYQETPQKFNNKTNGISHRRWLLTANPRLSRLICEQIGGDWIENPQGLNRLLDVLDNQPFLEDLQKVKRKNKEELSRYIKGKYGIVIDPASIFDAHIKRIHAYKRQLLNILHVFYLYLRLKEEPNREMVPHTFLFAGKAAPNYYYAKAVIKLIHSVADLVNRDPTMKDRLKVIFLENYGVTLAERIIPAADVSEQISTASQEASGTGNMKFMMNGAITIGTLDGANVEILEAVGEENLFLFGLKAEEVLEYYARGGYQARELYQKDERIPMVLEPLISGFFHSGYEEFHAIYHSLITDNDPFFILKDFDSYVSAHERLEKAFVDRDRWNRMSLIQIARSGRFSSDGTIQKYADEIWEIGSLEERGQIDQRTRSFS